MNYMYDKLNGSDSTVNNVSVTYTSSLCKCGSNHFIITNVNQTSSRMNSHLKCVKCGKEWGISYA